MQGEKWDPSLFEELSDDDTLQAVGTVSYTSRVLQPQVDSAKYGALQGCECSSGPCSSQSCPCAHMGQVQAYAYWNPENVSLVECGDRCSCDVSSCANRATQADSPIVSSSTLRLFLKSPVVGLGVKTLRKIPKGAFVTEYTGKLVPFDSAQSLRIKEDMRNYLLVFKENIPKHELVLCTCVDASATGNVGRFVNHSCEPNLDLVGVRVDSLIPRLCMFSKRDINEGEELTLSYGSKLGSKPCLCGATKCKGKLPFE